MRYLLAVVAVGALGIASTDASAAGDAERAGDAVVTTASAAAEALAGGDHDTPFALRLTDNAACPGDSADDGYRVQSFMVPAAVDPASIAYDGLGPTPNVFGDAATFRQPLYDTSTNWFVSASTAKAKEPGDPGAIVNLPAFSYAVYGTGDLPPGDYRIGIACTIDNTPVRYWDSEVVIEDTNTYAAPISWRVTQAPASTGANAQPYIYVVGAVAAGGAALVFIGSRRRRPREPGRPQ